MLILLIAFGAFCATLIGGSIALRYRDKLHLILGFSAGAVLGVAFFDLLPESIALGAKFYSSQTTFAFVALGFFTYLMIDRIILLHAGHHHMRFNSGETEPYDEHSIPRGILGAGSLTLHSFLDGVAIGLAFQISPLVGAVVTVAVLTHDFSDGVNTINMILKNRGGNRYAFRWLFVDALAPVAGASSTFFYTISQESLGLVLAVFSGFFLYIGASDLLPESQHAHPKFMTTAMTMLGAGVLYLTIHFATF